MPGSESMDSDFRTYAAGNIAKMPMVREIDDLTYLRHFGQQFEGFFRSEVIEGFHDVIRYERNHRDPSGCPGEEWSFGRAGIAIDRGGRLPLRKCRPLQSV